MPYSRFLIMFLMFWLSSASVALGKNTLKINVSGLNAPLQTAVSNRLNTGALSYGKNITEEAIQDFYANAPETIRKALQPYGYFKSNIQSHISQTESTWTTSFQVDPGPPIRIGLLDVKILGPGKDNHALQNYLATKFPLKQGDVFQSERYNQAKDDLFQIAINKGYIKATLVKKEIQIDLKNYTAKIIIYLDTGPRYYFGTVTFNTTPFNQAFLHRFIHLDPNEPYSSAKLLELQKSLANSHFFKEVFITPDFNNASDYHVPLKVDVTVPKAKQYTLGVGYGTLTGMRFTAGFNWRRVNDRGHHVSTQIKASSILKGIATTYYIPGNDPLTEQYTLGANIQKYTPSNGQSFSETLSAGYTKNLKHWHRGITLSYLNSTDNVNQTLSAPTDSHRALLYPTLSLSHTKVDDLVYPRHGSSINLILQGTSQYLLSTTSFVQGIAKGKYIFSPTPKGRVILSGQLGYTVVNNVQKLPLPLLFVAGGYGTIRGYKPTLFGPGKYLEVASVEYQHEIHGNWNGAVFYDTGTASNNFGGPYHAGYGVGVIYRSIIGPISVYFSRAKDIPPGKEGVSVDFSFGADL